MDKMKTLRTGVRKEEYTSGDALTILMGGSMEDVKLQRRWRNPIGKLFIKCELVFHKIRIRKYLETWIYSLGPFTSSDLSKYLGIPNFYCILAIFDLEKEGIIKDVSEEKGVTLGQERIWKWI